MFEERFGLLDIVMVWVVTVAVAVIPRLVLHYVRKLVKGYEAKEEERVDRLITERKLEAKQKKWRLEEEERARKQKRLAAKEKLEAEFQKKPAGAEQPDHDGMLDDALGELHTPNAAKVTAPQPASTSLSQPADELDDLLDAELDEFEEKDKKHSQGEDSEDDEDALFRSAIAEMNQRDLKKPSSPRQSSPTTATPASKPSATAPTRGPISSQTSSPVTRAPTSSADVGVYVPPSSFKNDPEPLPTLRKLLVQKEYLEAKQQAEAALQKKQIDSLVEAKLLALCGTSTCYVGEVENGLSILDRSLRLAPNSEAKKEYDKWRPPSCRPRQRQAPPPQRPESERTVKGKVVTSGELKEISADDLDALLKSAKYMGKPSSASRSFHGSTDRCF